MGTSTRVVTMVAAVAFAAARADAACRWFTVQFEHTPEAGLFPLDAVSTEPDCLAITDVTTGLDVGVSTITFRACAQSFFCSGCTGDLPVTISAYAVDFVNGEQRFVFFAVDVSCTSCGTIVDPPFFDLPSVAGCTPAALCDDPGGADAESAYDVTGCTYVPLLCGSQIAGDCFEFHPEPYCDDIACCDAVCQIDPFCCSTGGLWDLTCVDEALMLCAGCGAPLAGACFFPNTTPACEEPACCEAVCAADPACCELEWDWACVVDAFELCFQPNDECRGALPVTDGTTLVRNANATTDGPAHAGCVVPADVWYDYTATCTGLLTASTCDTPTFDTVIAVYFGGGCPEGDGALLACSEGDPDCPAAPGLASTVTVPVVAGERYRIRVGGVGGDQGIADLTLACAPGCPADLDGDGVVGIADFLGLLAAWGTDPGGPPDLDGDGVVGITDFLALLAAWGPCPDLTFGHPATGSCGVANGTPYCDAAACCTVVCGQDPSCCAVAWDDACAAAAASLCTGCGGASTGSCFEANGTPYCDDASCCAAVCAQDPSCCDAAWDAACGVLAGQLCGGCGDPAAGDCYVAGGTPGCADAACCADVCGLDPYCCLTAWDVFCVGHTADLCPACGNPALQICRVSSPEPFCADAACCELVCASIPSCCEIAWDDACVAETEATCYACGGVSTGDCLQQHFTPACDDEFCCGVVCAVDPFCCDVLWLDACVTIALGACFHCEVTCPGGGSCSIECPPGEIPLCICDLDDQPVCDCIPGE